MFSAEWDIVYKNQQQMSLWPWSDLVRFCSRYATLQKQITRVLELGCGAGANIPYFDSLGVQYHAIEGSATIVSNIHKRFPHLNKNIVVGDFCEFLPPGKFDLIVDRGSVSCNDSDSISKCLQLCYESLKPQGYYIGIDWYSTKSTYYSEGVQAEDEWTKTKFERGGFKGLGKFHFADINHLRELLSDFEILALEHKTVQDEMSSDKEKICSWNFVAKK